MVVTLAVNALCQNLIRSFFFVCVVSEMWGERAGNAAFYLLGIILHDEVLY